MTWQHVATAAGALLLALTAWVWGEIYEGIKKSERKVRELSEKSIRQQDQLEAVRADVQTLRVLHTDTPHGPGRSVEIPTAPSAPSR